jgi:hypothetical protein
MFRATTTCIIAALWGATLGHLRVIERNPNAVRAALED